MHDLIDRARDVAVARYGMMITLLLLYRHRSFLGAFNMVDATVTYGCNTVGTDYNVMHNKMIIHQY